MANTPTGLAVTPSSTTATASWTAAAGAASYEVRLAEVIPAGTVTIAGTATLAEGDATSTQVVIPVPAGAAVGEYLLAHVTHSSTGATPPSIAAPTGWTKIIQADGQGSTSQGTAVFYRPVVASEPASYTFPTNPTPGRVTGIMVRLAGVHSTTQLDTAAVTATSIATTNPIVVPALTTVTPGAMVLYAASINAATAGDLVAPAEVTLLTKATGTGRRAGLYYEARPTAGSTGTRTFSHTSATQVQWAVIGVALRPAAGVAGANLQSSASSTADATDSVSTTLTASRTASSSAGAVDAHTWSMTSAPLTLSDSLANVVAEAYANRTSSTGDEAYDVPTSGQAATLAGAFGKLMTGDHAGAAADVAPLGYEVVLLTDTVTGRQHALLRERLPATRYWGFYVWSRDAGRTGMVVEAPHTKADLNTHTEAQSLFDKANAKAFLLSTAHRNSNAATDADGDRVSDLANADVVNPFQSVHVTAAVAGSTVVQLHGYANASEPAYDVIVSEGQPSPTARAQGIAQNIRSVAGLRVGVYDGTVGAGLGATGNVQGIQSRAAGVYWVHVEQNTDVRSTAATRGLVEDALATAAVVGADVTSTASSAAGATDTASTVLTAARSASSDAGAVDTASTALTAVRAASSDAAATDSHSWTMARGLDAAASSSAAVTDSVSTTLTTSRAAADVAGATDTASTALTASRTASDTAGAVDTASTSLTAVRSATSTAGATDSATWSLIGPDRYIDWQGHNWWVRKGTGAPTASNPNAWGNGTENVEILPDGKLKLAITQVNGVWTAAEVDQNDANIVGYGRFRWVYDIDALGLDYQPVLGLYVFDSDPASAPSNREMDIEVTRWGTAAEQSRFWYSVHPTNTNNLNPAQGQPILHRQGNHRVSSAGPYTSEFIWQPGQVYFRTTAADGSVVGEHVVTEGVQTPGGQRLSMNLWLNSGTGGPSNGQPVTAVIHSFEHTPGVTHDLVPAAQYADDFPDVQGWALRSGADVTAGDLVLPTASTTYSTAYTGHVLDMRESSAQIEVTGVPAATGNTSQEAIWHVRFDESNEFMLFVSGGQLQGRVRRNGVNTNTAGAAFNATTHRWWRISESAGTVTFATSANGTAWSTLGSLAHTLTAVQLSAMRHQLDGGSWNAADAAAAPAPFTVARVGAVPALDLQASASDSAGATDSVTTALTAVRSAASSAGATDAASTTLDAQRAAVDAAPVTDTVSTTLDAQRSTVSTAGAVDSVSVAIDYVRTATSGAGATDSAGASLTAVRSATSAAGAVDAASTAQDYGRSASSGAGAVDSAARTLDAVRTASSTADARDEINISAAGQTTVTATSSAGATDTVAVIRNVVINVSSGVGAVDAVATAADIRRSASSAAGAVDAASTSAAVGIDRAAVSTAGATDSATTSVDHGRGAVSAAGASDNVTWEMARVITRFAVSGAGAVDDIAAIRDVHRTAVSTAGATDTVATGGGLQITATSEAGATDSVTWTITTFRGAYQVTYSKLRSAVTRGRLRSASTSRHEET